MWMGLLWLAVQMLAVDTHKLLKERSSTGTGEAQSGENKVWIGSFDVKSNKEGTKHERKHWQQ